MKWVLEWVKMLWEFNGGLLIGLEWVEIVCG